MNAQFEPPPSRLAVWWRALRAYSFPASIVPCLVGAAYAAAAGAPVRWLLLPLVLLAGVAIHVATNLVNDAADFQRGVDRAGAQGGSGVLTDGWLTARQVWIGAAAAALVALVAAVPLFLRAGWPLVAIAAAGAFGGYAYTGPPFGLKYRALGEPLVFVMMGMLMVVGSALALTGSFPPGVWAASTPVGFLVAAILAVNNQRDREDERHHGFRTLAILLGPRGASLFSSVLVAGAYAALAALVGLRTIGAWALLPLATLPLAAPVLRDVLRAARAPMPPRTVERTAALHLAFGLAYAVGLLLAWWRW
jgi:1,4-dihydroxy-2-naphthoate octaprenyltransferase